MGKCISQKRLIRSEVRARYYNRLRECRLRGLIISEAELARRTGIERTTISALENNRRFLSIEQALLTREVLGCSLDDLYEPVPSPKSAVLASEIGSVRR
jgi:transcriptional regulator with XRE-family HTH domain